MNKFVVITYEGESLGIAWQLHRAGKEVILGIVEEGKTVKRGPKSDELEKRRRDMGKGILNVRKAEELVVEMQGWEDKNEWFVFCDFAHEFQLASKLKGFKYGMFPQRFDYEMETDRDLAKDFVKKNYPMLKTPETQEFSSIDDAIEFINESEEFWALKGNSPEAKTVVPNTELLDHAREEIIDALTSDKADYESKGLILERQIRDGVETCVEAMFWNGEMICTILDLELKPMGSGNLSYQVGCANNLVMEIPMDCELVKMGIPDAVHKIAKKHRGWFIMDANIIFKDGDAYFLEFCVRPGYDSLVTSMAMGGGVSEFFDALVEGENPYQYTYGVGVRGMNLKTDEGMPKAGLRMRWSPDVEDDLYPWNIAKEDGSYYDTGAQIECMVFTGVSDDPEYAAIKAFAAVKKFSFDSLYYRPQSDWTSRDYKGNITDRLEGVQRYIAAPTS